MRKKISQKDLGTLSEQEIDLLHLIRTRYRYGSIEILVRDGVPIDVLKTVSRERLG